MFKQYAKGVWDIFLLRGGPQSLPYSPLILLILLAAGLGIVFAATGMAALLFASNVAFLLMMVWLLLYFTKKQERYVQTMIALISCEWLMSILFLVFWYAILLITALSGHLKGVSSNHLSGIFQLQLNKDTLPPVAFGVLGLGIILLLIWKLMIDISIIRQSTEWRTLRTIAFILLLNFIPAMVQQGLVKAGVGGTGSSSSVVAKPAVTGNKTISLNQ